MRQSKLSATPTAAALATLSLVLLTMATRPAAAEVASDEASSGELTIDEFTQLHQRLTKMSRERVWSIPWQLSVRKARELAAKADKPVFLWISSNGGTHPLGPC